MSLHHELFPMFGIQIRSPMSVAGISTMDGLRKTLAQRMGAALAAAIDEIIYARVGRDVDLKSLTGRGNIVQRGWDGDYHVTLDGKLIGVIKYPDIGRGSSRLEYTLNPESGEPEQCVRDF